MTKMTNDFKIEGKGMSVLIGAILLLVGIFVDIGFWNKVFMSLIGVLFILLGLRKK